MGADGGTTYGQVIQPSTKIRILADQVIVGGAGSVGMGQLCFDRIEQLWSQTGYSESKGIVDVQREIQEAIRSEVDRNRPQAVANIPLIGQQQAMAMLDTAVLVGARVGGNSGRSELYYFDWLGNTQNAQDNLPSLATSSGAQLALPFLSFLRSVFWPNGPPNIANGVYSVVWTLTYAIRHSTFGLADPIQVVLVRDSESPIIHELSKAEIGQHQDRVAELEYQLQEWFAGDGSDPPSAPPPLQME